VAEEEDAFQGAVTACLSVLVLGTETRLDAALAAMTRVPWASLEAARPCPGALPAALASSDCPLAQAAPAAGPSVRSAIAGTPRGPLRVRERGAARAQVGDQSDFVTAFSRVLSEVAPAVGGALSPLHFRYFCDKLAASFCPRFYENIFRRAPGGRAWPPAHWLRRMLTGGRSRERGACAPVSAAATRAGAVEEAAFWWSNCVQLRWMLWAMSHAAPELELPTDDAGHPADDFDWVMQVCRSFTVLFPAQLAHRQRRSC